VLCFAVLCSGVMLLCCCSADCVDVIICMDCVLYYTIENDRLREVLSDTVVKRYQLRMRGLKEGVKVMRTEWVCLLMIVCLV